MSKPCGCQIEMITQMSHAHHMEINYCPLHKHAGELLEACKKLRSLDEIESEYARFDFDSIDVVIAKVEGKELGKEWTYEDL